MAIAHVGTPVSDNDGDTSTLTLAVTVPEGCDCMVFDGGWSHSDTTALQSVVYNGDEALTQVTDLERTEGFWRASQWALLNPTPGSFNVVATLQAGQDEFGGGIRMYSGVDSVRSGSATELQGNSGDPGISVACQAGDMVVDCLLYDDLGANTPDAEQTRRWQEINLAGNNFNSLAVSDRIAAANPQAMGWTIPNVEWTYVGFALVPAATAGLVRPIFSSPVFKSPVFGR